jgi:hypothetical protein
MQLLPVLSLELGVCLVLLPAAPGAQLPAPSSEPLSHRARVGVGGAREVQYMLSQSGLSGSGVGGSHRLAEILRVWRDDLRKWEPKGFGFFNILGF